MGECFFGYWPTRVVPDEALLNDCVLEILKFPSNTRYDTLTVASVPN